MRSTTQGSGFMASSITSAGALSRAYLETRVQHWKSYSWAKLKSLRSCLSNIWVRLIISTQRRNTIWSKITATISLTMPVSSSSGRESPLKSRIRPNSCCKHRRGRHSSHFWCRCRVPWASPLPALSDQWIGYFVNIKYQSTPKISSI